MIGKFQGKTAPTIPIGSRTISPRASGRSGRCRRTACRRPRRTSGTFSIVSGGRPRQSVIGLPARANPVRQLPQIRLEQVGEVKQRHLALGGGARDQRPSSNARRAAARHGRYRPRPPAAHLGHRATRRRVLGRESSTAPAGWNAPSIKASVRNAGSTSGANGVPHDLSVHLLSSLARPTPSPTGRRRRSMTGANASTPSSEFGRSWTWR